MIDFAELDDLTFRLEEAQLVLSHTIAEVSDGAIYSSGITGRETFAALFLAQIPTISASLSLIEQRLNETQEALKEFVVRGSSSC